MIPPLPLLLTLLLLTTTTTVLAATTPPSSPCASASSSARRTSTVAKRLSRCPAAPRSLATTLVSPAKISSRIDLRAGRQRQAGEQAGK